MSSEKKKKLIITDKDVTADPKSALTKVVAMLQEKAPEEKETLNALREGLKAYSKTVQQIIKDIAMDYIAFKKGKLSDDPDENKEWYDMNVAARKTALELYAIKAIEDELGILKYYLEEIGKAAIPYLSVIAKGLVGFVIGQ